MNTNKTKKYLLPIFATVFALMLVAAAPSVVAEPDGDDSKHNYDKKSYKDNKEMEVEGFTGSIMVPDMSEVKDKRAVYQELKSQITVNLSDAAIAAENAGLEVTKAKLEKVVNENGERFVVWKLVQKDHSADSDMVTKTILVIDAADVTNTATVTKEYEKSMKMNHERYSSKNMLNDPEKIENKIAKIEKKINKGDLVAEQVENKIQYIYLLRQLQTALYSGDDTQADSLREQLQELRNQMIDMKSYR